MHRAGTALVVLALVAVQAPWIVCACGDAVTCTPLVAGILHGDTHDHETRCHCTGHPNEQDEQDEPQDEPQPSPTDDHHEVFRVALAPPTTDSIALDRAFTQVVGLCPDTAALRLLTATSEVGGAHAPPESTAFPGAADQRLLL